MVMESRNQGSDVSDLAQSEPSPPPHGLLGRRHSVDSNIGRTRPPTFIRTYREVKWKRMNHPGRLLPRSAQLDTPAAAGLTEAESREYIHGTHIIRQRVPIFMTSCDPQGELGRRFSAGDLVPVTGLSQNWTSYGKCLFIRNSPPNDGSMNILPHASSSSYVCSLSASNKKRLDLARDDDDRGFLMIDEDDEEDFTDDGSEEEEEEDDEMRDKSSSNRDSGVCVCDYIDKLSTSCPTPAGTILLDKPSVSPARHSDTVLKSVPTDPGDLSRFVVHDAGESWPLLSEQEDARSWAHSQAVGSTTTRLHVPWMTTETAVSSVACTPSETKNADKAVPIFGGLSVTPTESVFTDGVGRPVPTLSGVSSPLSSESIFTDEAGRPVFYRALPGVSSPTSSLSVFTNGTGRPVLAPAMSSVLSPLSTNGASVPVMVPLRSKTDVVFVGNGSEMMPATSQPSTKPVLNKSVVMHTNTQPVSHVVATSHPRATTVSSHMISSPCAIHRTSSNRAELPRPVVEDRSWGLASSKIAGTSAYVCTCRPLSSKTNGMSARAVTRPVPINLEEAIATRVELVKISIARESEPLLFQKVTYSSGPICCSAHWVAPTKGSRGSGVATGCPGVRQTGLPSSVHRPAATRTDLPAADVSDGSFAVGKVGGAQQPFLIISDLSRDVSLTLAAATTKGKYIVVKVTKDNVGVEETSQIMLASDTATFSKDSNGCMDDENYGASSNFFAKSTVNTQPEQEAVCQRERTQSEMVDKQVLSTSHSCVQQDKSVVNAGKHHIPQTTGTTNDEPDSCTGLSQKAVLRDITSTNLSQKAVLRDITSTNLSQKAVLRDITSTGLSQKAVLRGISGTDLSQKAVLQGVSEPTLATSASKSDCMYTTARASSAPTTNQAPAVRLSSSDTILGGAPVRSRTDHNSANLPLSGVVGMQLDADPQSQTDNIVNGSENFHHLICENSLTNLLESNVKSKDCFTITVTSSDLSSHVNLDVEDQSSMSSRDLDKLSPTDVIGYNIPSFHVRLNDRDRDSNTQITSIKEVEDVENVDDGLSTEDGDLLPALIQDISEVENVQESSSQAQGGGGSTVAIDNKIEQAMDLVKRHLMYAVREEVEILKQQIGEMVERIGQLEYENTVLRSEARPETLNKLQQPRVNSAAVTAAPQPPSSSQQPAVSSQTTAASVSAAPAPQPTQAQPSSQPPLQQQQQHLQQPSTSQVPPPSASSSS